MSGELLPPTPPGCIPWLGLCAWEQPTVAIAKSGRETKIIFMTSSSPNGLLLDGTLTERDAHRYHLG
jgi:hypothetical protein